MRVSMVKTFLQVASTRSIPETARRLSYSESTVLYHLRELEKSWHIRLFVSNSREMLLTSDGQRAAVLATDLLRTAHRLEALGGAAALRGRSTNSPCSGVSRVPDAEPHGRQGRAGAIASR